MPAVAVDGPVWPPIASSAPAEVVWQGTLTELRPKGLGRVFRAVAGAERRQQSWQLPQPVAVAVMKDRIYVVDTALGRVLGARTDGRSAVRLELPDDVTPVALAVTADEERILVADRDSGAVHAFDSKGEHRGVAVPAGLVRRCGGIGACANGDLLMTDAEAGQVVRVRPNGSESARSGGPGTAAGEFNTPTAVVEAPDGTIWVLDTFNFRLQQLDPELRHLSHFGEHGDGSGHLALAKGLAVDPDGHLYVSDARFDAVQVFDEDGKLLFIIGGRGVQAGEFWNPGGLAIDRRGRIAVADTGNRRVQIMRYQRRDQRK
jgi:DNA-binding beta-propeller fold protein YncE